MKIRLFLGTLLAPVLLLAGVVASPLPADARPAGRDSCAVTWGSTPKSAGPSTSPRKRITDVRAGMHPCYDRLVVDLTRTGAAGYDVRYVRHVHHVASGEVIPVMGGARLEITIRASVSSTYPAVDGQRLPGVDLTGFQTFREAKYGGSFEGITVFGLGVRARLPFRVFKLDDRVVIDVAHSWT